MTAVTTTAPAAPPARHIGPVRALGHGRTLAWRAVTRIRRNPEQLLDVTLSPIIFVTLFVYLFGGEIQGQSRHTYLQYVLPGVLVQTVIFASAGTGMGLATDITKGIFDRFRSLPIARSAPLSGAIVGDMARYGISIVIVFAYGYLLGYRVQTGLLPALAAVGLTVVFAFGVCWIWALLGLFVKSPQTVQGLSFLVMFPLTFGSNVFATTQSMPGWLQAWVKINPVTHLTSAMRGLLNGGPVFTSAWHALAWSAGFVVVFAPLAVRRYRRVA